MVRRKHRLMSLLLTVLMVLSLATVATTATISAASGDTVYCQNDKGWGEVYCYMWTDDSNKNANWPGVKMTKGEGNLWSYTVTGDWGNIIFNNGQGDQTGDMTHQGNGSCYNNSNGNWSKIDTPDPKPTNPTPTNPTPTNPTPTNPTPTNPTPTGKNVVYCKNEAGWGSVSIYMWNSDDDKISSWPGKTATNVGDNVWVLEYDKDYAKIIFNNGSGTQTDDLTHPGSGYIYNNANGKWEIYDPTMLRIVSTKTTPESPQYTGVEVKLSMEAAGGEGALLYKISANNTVISDFSANNSVVWTPTQAGTYTLKYEVKDETGNTKSETSSFTVKDITAEKAPVVQKVEVTPTNAQKNEILKGKEATVDITAGGGKTGTNLLFYKVKITDPAGNTANVPYYTTKDVYKFTPASLGTYTIEVSVQNSDNTTEVRTYEYESVSALSAPGELTVSLQTAGKTQVGSTVTVTASASGGTAPYTYQFKVGSQIVKAYSSVSSYAFELTKAGNYAIEVTAKDATGKTATKSVTITATSTTDPTNPTPSNPNPTNPSGGALKGDADCDNEVNIKDATAIQKHIALLEMLSSQGETNADVDIDNDITIKDATMIQKHIAGIDVNW